MSFIGPDGRLILAKWANAAELLLPEATVPMYGTAARATPLVTNGFLGVDLIQIPAGEGFDPHTHIGDHLLIVVKGTGTITYEGVVYVTHPGEVYQVEGAKAHAVGAIEDHALLSVGAPHRAADAADRMALTEYAAVAADLGELICLACNRKVRVGDAECPHVPHPRKRQVPVALSKSWDTWEREKLAEWFGVRETDLARVVQLVAFEGDVESAVRALHGRVVIAYGKVAGALLTGLMPDKDYKVERWQAVGADSSLLITVRWAAAAGVQRVILRLAHTLAAAGPLEREWSGKDAYEMGWAIDRAEAAG